MARKETTQTVTVAQQLRDAQRQLTAVHKQQAELAKQERELGAKVALLKVQTIQDAYTDKSQPFSVVIAYQADTKVPALVNKVTIKNLKDVTEAQAVAKKILALKLGNMTTVGTAILNGRKKVKVYATETFKGCYPAFKREGWYFINEEASK